MCSILKYVAASEAEMELGVFFNKARIGKIICLTLIELVYLQLPTPMQNDNSTSAGIVINTVK